jgi:hypothetical protein
VIVAAATITAALAGSLAPVASAAESAQPAAVQHPGTVSPAGPRSAGGRGPGGVGMRMLDVQASEVNNPRAREYIVDSLAPGETIRQRIVVSNTTASGLHVAIYPAGAAITGGTFVGAAGHTADDLSAWTTVSRPTLAVPAGGAVVETVTIAIPPQASPGERYAVVWAEVRSAQARGPIELVNRAGIRMYVYVGGNNPATSFTVETLTGQRNSGGDPLVRAQVRNTGGLALDFSGTLTLSSVTGKVTAGPYPAELGTTLAPGQSEPVWFAPAGQVTDGPWNATVTLHSGLAQQSYSAKITFPRGPGTAPPGTARPVTGRFGVLAILLLILIALLVAAAILIITYRRRGRRQTA